MKTLAGELLKELCKNEKNTEPKTYIVSKLDHLDGNPPEITQVQECRNDKSGRYISAEEFQRIVSDRDTVINLIDNLECSV